MQGLMVNISKVPGSRSLHRFVEPSDAEKKRLAVLYADFCCCFVWNSLFWPQKKDFLWGKKKKPTAWSHLSSLQQTRIPPKKWKSQNLWHFVSSFRDSEQHEAARSEPGTGSSTPNNTHFCNPSFSSLSFWTKEGLSRTCNLWSHNYTPGKQRSVFSTEVFLQINKKCKKNAPFFANCKLL